MAQMLVFCEFGSSSAIGFVPDGTPLDAPFALQCSPTAPPVSVLGQFCKVSVVAETSGETEAQKVATIYDNLVRRQQYVSEHGFARLVGEGLIEISTGRSTVQVHHTGSCWSVRGGLYEALDTNLEIAASLVVNG
jgi:hypothetical protein